MLHIRYDPNPQLAHIQFLQRQLAAHSVAQVPILAELPHNKFAVVLRQADRIVGGALAELEWGWLYTDTLWVEDAMHGRGYGAQILLAAEGHAAQRGVVGSYLMTTSFQARPFYERLGYTLFAEQAERPIGHTYYYLHKDDLLQQPHPTSIQVIANPDAAIIKLLDQGLIAHADAHAPLVFRALAAFAYDDLGRIQGGIYGTVYWDWLDLRVLWLAPQWHGNGYGRELLHVAEAKARSYGLRGIIADVADWQNLGFFMAQQFTIIGHLHDRPPGRVTHWLEKRL